MNLETFKARARRKLALPPRTSPTPVATPLLEPENTTPATPPDTPIDASLNSAADPSPSLPQSPSADEDRFASAMRLAARTNADTNQFAKAKKHSGDDNMKLSSDGSNDTAIQRWPGSESPTANPTPFQSVTGAKSNDAESSDTQLARLRSLLLGSEYQSQQDHAEEVYQRTQADLNALRSEIDTRLTVMSDQVTQLEDALDARLTELLETERSELGERRAANRDHLETKLAAITDRGDQQLQAVSQRLEASIADMQLRISDQLSNQSSTTVTAPDADISALRAQLEALIDERVRSVNEEQTSGMRQLRDVMLAQTNSIKTELQAQTQAQKTQLATHRQEIESQFNGALTTLNDNKVSHQELSRLLARLADRIQQL